MIKTPIYFECDCRSPEHTLKFSIDYDPDFPNTSLLCVETYINQYRNFCRRFVVAIAYFFGYKSRCSDFDTFIFKDQDIEELQSLLKEFKKLKRKKNAKIN